MNGAASFGRKSFGRLNVFADSCMHGRTLAIVYCATKCLLAKCFLTEGRGTQPKTNFEAILLVVCNPPMNEL
jgi:hypothetical protein